jgi:hypothetical protein
MPRFHLFPASAMGIEGENITLNKTLQHLQLYLVGGLEPWNFLTFPSYWEFHHRN